ncbi:amino acid permease [Planctomicrobium sp. SH661]|uniref:amino acid permease n=1 Tax=Planctomicrobium sp. SH661 TaxID=3448124 RepID=UPI003F5C55E6
MSWKRMFERKTLSMLQAELQDEKRLHRVLGPVALTSLGVGAIIGAGIFAMTGRVAAEDAGPAVILSFAIAGVACLFAAMCYAEFAALAPVAGSAYTYTYATLGEVWAWIIGWDLILEYAMSCSVVAAHWTHYLDEALRAIFRTQSSFIPAILMSDPFTKIQVDGAMVQPICNLPAILIILAITYVLVIGIRESAAMNTLFVVIKLAVVLIVIGLGLNYVTPSNWTGIPIENRRETNLPDYISRHPELAAQVPEGAVTSFTTGAAFLSAHPELAASLPANERIIVEQLPNEAKKWGLLSVLGVKHWLDPIDNASRSPFMPYGISGLMIGAALVFFAYIGFDSISTHAEESVRPQRDVPLAILASLVLCTVLYMLVSGVITGMEPYWQIDANAALASAFRKRAQMEKNPLLDASAALIAVGAVAGLTSVILVNFLSQSRIFLAMARDGLLPTGLFGVVHEKYRTPHRSTILTGVLIAVVAGFFPIRMLEEMVSIGTLMAFVLVCGSVLILRIRSPQIERPFRCPLLFIVAPLGIFVNLALMLFLPLDTWLRLVIWLGMGMAIYFSYGLRNSVLRKVTSGDAT